MKDHIEQAYKEVMVKQVGYIIIGVVFIVSTAVVTCRLFVEENYCSMCFKACEGNNEYGHTCGKCGADEISQCIKLCPTQETP